MRASVSLVLVLLLQLGMSACANEAAAPNPPANPASLSIVTTALPTATVSLAYSVTVAASGTMQTGFVWSVVVGVLPAGLSLQQTGAPSATISGTPLVTGTVSFTLQVADSAGAEALRTLSMAVAPQPPPHPPLSIVTGALPSGFQGGFYSTTLTALGGSQSGYTWSVVSGALPAAFVLANAGTPSISLSGTETGFGQFAFSIEVQDSLGNKASRPYTLDILQSTFPPVSSCYGSTVSGRLLFVVDTSDYVYGSAITAIRQELTNCISNLRVTDEFDVIAYSSKFGVQYVFLWGTLMPATPANIASALAFVAGPNFNAQGSVNNAQYPVLQFAYSTYYPNVNHLFFVAGMCGTDFYYVLTTIATWHATDPNRQVHAIAYGSNPNTLASMQSMAGITGGSYLRP